MCLPLLGKLPGASSLDEGGGAAGLLSLEPGGQEPPDAQLQQAPVAVVIMALARSGSTLLGQMFRQNQVGSLRVRQNLSVTLFPTRSAHMHTRDGSQGFARHAPRPSLVQGFRLFLARSVMEQQERDSKHG